MQEIKRYQVRGLPGEVSRVAFGQRIVDFWGPEGGSDRVLIAHDGQNIFDRRTATFVYTWRLGQSAIRVAREISEKPPLVIGIFHSSSKSDPHGRGKDLTPEEPFRNGVKPLVESVFKSESLRGNEYLDQIFNLIAPTIADRTHSRLIPERTAMIGSSMGGLATLYALTRHPDKFSTALALSTHWPIGGEPLVDWLTTRIPNDGSKKVWMSRGTKGLDASYPPFQDYADKRMSELGWRDSHFKSKVFHRTTHNERSWASYVDEPLRFWLS